MVDEVPEVQKQEMQPVARHLMPQRCDAAA
jgi:hypothetical protein